MIIDQLIKGKKENTAITFRLNEPIYYSDKNRKNLNKTLKQERFLFFFRKRRFIRNDSSVKSVIKAISWRLVGTLDTILISFLITKKLSFAISIGGIEVFTKIALYYVHERIWLKIRF